MYEKADPMLPDKKQRSREMGKKRPARGGRQLFIRHHTVELHFHVYDLNCCGCLSFLSRLEPPLFFVASYNIRFLILTAPANEQDSGNRERETKRGNVPAHSGIAHFHRATDLCVCLD